jgi:hypothetical protein
MQQSYGLLDPTEGPDPSKPSFTAKSSVFMQDCRMNRTARTDYELIYCCNDYVEADSNDTLPYGNTPSTRPAEALDARHPFPAITYTPSAVLLDHMVANVGAFPRDPMDQRLMADPAAGTFSSTPLDVNPAGDSDQMPFATPPAPPADSDGDGMPDAWESAHGLSPTNAADGASTSLSVPELGLDGYTNLEVYLEALSRERILGP